MLRVWSDEKKKLTRPYNIARHITRRYIYVGVMYIYIVLNNIGFQSIKTELSSFVFVQTTL